MTVNQRRQKMNNGFAVTFLLKDIFPTLDSFKTFLQNYTNVDKDATTNAYLYKYILAKFHNSNVNYDTLSRVNTFAHVNHTTEQTRLGVLLCINGVGILNSWIKRNIAPEGISYNE